jgi:hypothetical protein
VIQLIEDAILARATAVLTIAPALSPNVEVRSYPEVPEEYNLTHPVGAALVRYDGLVAEEPDAANFQYQVAVIQFEITLLMRSLRKTSGAYDNLTLIRGGFVGWRLEVVKNFFARFYLVEEVLQSEQNAIWIYSQRFAARVIVPCS